MRIFKRGNTYWYEFEHRGRRYRKSTGLRNRRAALDYAAAERTALIKGEVGIVEKKKVRGFKSAMTDFLKWSEHEHKAHPGTFLRYRYSSIPLLAHFKDVALDKITPDEVEQYKRIRSAQVSPRTHRKVKPATVNRELACLRAMFNHLTKADVWLKNPIRKTAVKPLSEDNEQIRVVDYGEQEQYLAVASPMLRDVATLMLETGMRPEEVFRIHRENVDLAQGFLVNPYGKTKAARRRVPLTTAASSVLAARMSVDGTWLFPCDTDAVRPVPNMHSAHQRAIRESKVVPFRLYDLRHTWATRAAMSGIDLVTLAAMLGHSRIQMVLRYAHPTHQHQTRAMLRLEQLVAEQRIARKEVHTKTPTVDSGGYVN